MTQFDIMYTDFKREDTTNDITIKLYADNKRPIIPNPSHTWKAKVAREISMSASTQLRFSATISSYHRAI